MHRVSFDFEGFRILGGAVVLAYVFSFAIQAVDQWSKAVDLRRGKFRSLPGPGLSSPRFCDLRSRSRAVPCGGFGAEKGDSD
jgi:hypothetical protein